MRLFTGIEIPREILDNVASLLARLKPTARIQWSPTSNLHITTKFIGEWSEAKLADLTGALTAIPAAGSIQIRVNGLGFFPNAKSPRIFRAGVEGSLSQLAIQTDRALSALGIAPEPRVYSPHLTLARIKKPDPLADLHKAIGALDNTDFGAFDAVEFHLYRSCPGPSGSVYDVLATFPLQR